MATLTDHRQGTDHPEAGAAPASERQPGQKVHVETIAGRTARGAARRERLNCCLQRMLAKKGTPRLTIEQIKKLTERAGQGIR